MSIEDKAHTFEVALAYAGTAGLLVAIVALTFIQARRARASLDRIEGRDG